MNDGPLGDGGSSWTLCLPSRPGGALTDAFSSFRNTGGSVAVIDAVKLYEPKRLRLVGAYVVRVTGNDLIGDVAGFPPSLIPAGVHWTQRQRAVGARIPPYPPSLPSNDVVNLVVGIAPTGRGTGTTQAIDVYYHEGGRSYVERMNTQLVVKVAPARC